MDEAVRRSDCRHERPVREVQGRRQDGLPESDGDAEPEPALGREAERHARRPRQTDRRPRLRLRPRTEGRLDGLGRHPARSAAAQRVRYTPATAHFTPVHVTYSPRKDTNPDICPPPARV